MGAVTRISPVAVNETRRVAVYIRVSEGDQRLRGGMFVSGSIYVGQEADRIVIPAASLKENGEGHYVLRLEQGRLVRQAVSFAEPRSGHETVEVLQGLRAGDKIVTVPLPELRPDVAVKLLRAA